MRARNDVADKSSTPKAVKASYAVLCKDFYLFPLYESALGVILNPTYSNSAQESASLSKNFSDEPLASLNIGSFSHWKKPARF